MTKAQAKTLEALWALLGLWIDKAIREPSDENRLLRAQALSDVLNELQRLDEAAGGEVLTWVH
jgi:hypothetical protein